ncbi:MAG: NfeD family protein [Bacteroidaceae bacterium]|nr:NfeD family protein [Bacteroidaceae bacterium]
MTTTIFWAILMLVCAFFELLTGGLYIICLSVGALAAIPVAAMGLSLTWQIVVFVIVSVGSIYTLRPLAKRYLHRKDERDTISNADAILGRIGTVSQDIPAHGYGRVALDGDDWKAQTLDGQPLAKGTRVRIAQRKSLVVTVEPAN